LLKTLSLFEKLHPLLAMDKVNQLIGLLLLDLSRHDYMTWING